METKFGAVLLAAGYGTRLAPLTDIWPKALMPIGGRPLMDYWLKTLRNQNFDKVIVNTHYLNDVMSSYLKREAYRGWVSELYEKELLGTAGTLRAAANQLGCGTIFLAHVDNWGLFDISHFLQYHLNRRPPGCVITMLTFESDNPSSCGVVELNTEGIVEQFHEKVKSPPSRLANGAVYMIEQEVLTWLNENETVTDFSSQVIPNFLGRIATFNKVGVYRDIGTVDALRCAQLDPIPDMHFGKDDSWFMNFRSNPIHSKIVRPY